MEWVEATGKSVELAVEAALAELDLESRDAADIEVLQQPRPGFLGLGAQEAIVKVSAKPAGRKRRRRRGRRKPEEAERGNGRSERAQGEKTRGNGRSGGHRGDGGRSPRQPQPRSEAKEKGPARRREKAVSGGKEAGSSSSGREKEQASIEEQAEVAATFIKGLLRAYGLEGDVATEISDDVLRIDVSGDQTEALVGPKGAVLQSVLEVTRTVVQRQTFGAPRMRLDIAGYNERRREALKIYAGKLADKVLEQGGEVMLEPMNAADRKVVHDAVAEIEGVRSFSEGEDPDRSVVIAAE